MKWKKMILACMVCVIALFTITTTYNVAFAENEQPETISPTIVKEGSVIRESQKYPDVQYKPMTYINEKWYWNTNEVLENLKAAWKEITWFANFLIAKVGCEIVFNLFSLDIVDKTSEAVGGIMGETAKAVTGDLLLFFLALTGGYIAIRAYVQQNWSEFLKILTKTLISMSLLYSLFGNAQTYVTFGNDLSKYIENAALKINPSLTASQQNEYNESKTGDTLKSNEIGARIENKVFAGMIYKPFLHLNYGTTDEAAITKDDKDRITNYLQANEFSEKGLEKRKDLVKEEYEKKGNSAILANNIPSQMGSLTVAALTNLIQIAVYFILALVRIVLQLAFIVLLIGLPLVLVFSLFPALENMVYGYIKAIFSVITFKALTVFVVLIAVSFLSIGYDITNASDKTENRVFTQLVITVATIALWFKRDFIMHALNGQHHRILESASNSVNGVGEKLANTGKSAMRHARHKETLDAIRQKQEGAGNGAGKDGKSSTPSTGSKLWDKFSEGHGKDSDSRSPEAEAAATKEDAHEAKMEADAEKVSGARTPNLEKDSAEQPKDTTHHTDNDAEKVSSARTPQVVAGHQTAGEPTKETHQDKHATHDGGTSENRSPKVASEQVGTEGSAGKTEQGKHIPTVVPMAGSTKRSSHSRNPNVAKRNARTQEQQGNKRVQQGRRVSGQRVASQNVGSAQPSQTVRPLPTGEKQQGAVSYRRNEHSQNTAGQNTVGQNTTVPNRSAQTTRPVVAAHMPNRQNKVEAPRQNVSSAGRRVSGQRNVPAGTVQTSGRRVSGQQRVVNAPAGTPSPRTEAPRRNVSQSAGRQVSGQQRVVNTPAGTPSPRTEAPRRNVSQSTGRRVSGQQRAVNTPVRNNTTAQRSVVPKQMTRMHSSPVKVQSRPQVAPTNTVQSKPVSDFAPTQKAKNNNIRPPKMSSSTKVSEVMPTLQQELKQEKIKESVVEKSIGKIREKQGEHV
ncbi:type IV secretion system protein [Bacillus cereus]|nr:type IV secretion system protein [Bacillus cereus]